MSTIFLKKRNVFSLGLLSILVLMFSFNHAEAKKSRVKGKLSLMQGSWKGTGTFQGRYFQCRTRVRKGIIRAACSEGNQLVRSRGRLRGKNRFTSSWNAGRYSGVTSFYNIGKSGHTMHVQVHGQGTAVLRMHR